MSQDNLIRMKCEETGDIGYVTRKNKKQNPDPIELMKYNPKLRKHTKYKEAK
ncbi:MAG: 50S ribosomal protein L33 [Candidatus Kaiserbacteria bacterium]|nr:50S ribosomal protein L33 [Candidatus Kaiserbacteria bacterium]